MFLAGDVGGTKTLLALFRLRGGRLRVVRERSYPSSGSSSLEAMIRDFLAEGGEEVRGCAVGVAGPVVDGVSHVVNLRWPVDARRLARALGLSHSHVMNDLEATAWGIPLVPARKLVSLTPGLRARPGNAALIAAGTGLGIATLVWDGERHLVAASEGGHQDFPPRDDVEIDLLRHLRRRHGRVSVERVVSGPGLSALFDFLVATGRGRPSPAMRRRLAAGDRNAAVSEAGVAGDDPLARRAVEMFASLYGAAAGNLALAARAVGGVYVAGGIAPRILSVLRAGRFMRSFRSKGRLRPLLERIPVKVVVEPRTALLGAAARAAHLETWR